MKVGLFTAMKNEGPFVLEWVAFHRMIGFNRILVFTNDCDDGTYEILDALGEIGAVKHIRQSLSSGDIPQYVAADIAYSHPYIQDAEWLMWLDADEFLFVFSENNHVEDMVARFPNVDGITVNWKIFGDNGIKCWTPELVTKSFTRCANDKYSRNRMFKTIFRRTDDIRGFGLHRPFILPSFRRNDRIIVNSAGQEMHEDIYGCGKWKRHALGEAPPHLQSFEGACICHYASKTHDSYLLKRQRGQGTKANNAENRSSRFQDAYWHRYNKNDKQSYEMSQISDRLDNEIKALMAIETVAKAQRFTQNRYANKLAEI